MFTNAVNVKSNNNANYDVTVTDAVHHEIRSLIMQPSYPCIAATQSVVRQDYMVGIYNQFGEGKNWEKLRADLIQFLHRLSVTKSRYLSFWAVFDDPETALTEGQFEEKFWNELSLISSLEERDQDWGHLHTANPDDPMFCLSINREKLFVVGLHNSSSRESRRFSKPAMVFNAFSQFEKFQLDGTYNKMVETNRNRDVKFQGNANPMAVAHGEKWESIQFSGKENSSKWKCPFRFFKTKDKPR